MKSKMVATRETNGKLFNIRSGFTKSKESFPRSTADINTKNVSLSLLLSVSVSLSLLLFWGREESLTQSRASASKVLKIQVWLFGLFCLGVGGHARQGLSV